MDFTEFGLSEKISESISFIGFQEPTPIQEQVIPLVMEGHDLIACAQTGTGKTAAYLIPVLNKLSARESQKVRALIMSPTRELALQIDRQLEGFTYFAGISSKVIYGGGSGSDWETEKKAITSGSDLLVATPGRLLSHISLGYVDFSALEYLILDEADRMMDMGFHEDIMRIYSNIPSGPQVLMFSATMPPKIRQLALKLMKEPREVNIAVSKPAEGVLQGAYEVYPDQKIPLIAKLIKGKELSSILIFSSTKRSTKDICAALKREKMDVGEMHSDLDQSQREETLGRFRNKKLQIIVATDVLSRGIDVEDIDLVINYDVPQDAEDYVHRVGRTARAAATGVAITFITSEDAYKFDRIESLIGSKVRRLVLPEDLGAGPEIRKDGPRKNAPRKNFRPPSGKKSRKKR